MTANQSANLDEEIRRFLEKGGQVLEVESNDYVPRRVHQSAREKPTHRAKRPRKVLKEKGLYVLTEAARIKADKAKPKIKKLLDEGWNLTDIRRKLKVDWKAVRVAAAELGYAGRYTTMAKWAPAVELVVQGLCDGHSVKETCAKNGIQIGAFLVYWPKYLERNPVAQALRAGHGCHPSLSDDDAALMMLLYQELTDISISRVLKTLKVGYHRADRILRDYSVSHPPFVLT